MRPSVTTGDVALTAHLATEEGFSPFGRLLRPGDRTYVGRRGRMLLAIDEKPAGPRRVTDLYRYPEAKRVLLPLGGVPMWFVALEPGEQADRRASAFLLPPGCGAVINEGVWHAGPTPLADASICEMLETTGSADRFDRRTLRELIDAAAVRVLLPDDPEERDPPFALTNTSLELDPALEGRVRIACVLLDGLRVEAECRELDAEVSKALVALRSMWSHAAALSEIPGVQVGREVFREAGIDQVRHPPPSETLLAAVLAGADVPGSDALERSLLLWSLRILIPVTGYDTSGLQGPIRVRLGAPDEAYPGPDGRRLVVEGVPVLSDSAGVIGGPLGAAQRSRLGTATSRALITAFCPRSIEGKTVEEWLDGLVRSVTEHCGGAEAGRLVLG